MDAIEDTCPLEDRVPERKVFQGLQVSAARQAMTRACNIAKIPHCSPHDLRHSRITLWHHEGIPARVLAEGSVRGKPKRRAVFVVGPHQNNRKERQSPADRS